LIDIKILQFVEITKLVSGDT